MSKKKCSEKCGELPDKLDQTGDFFEQITEIYNQLHAKKKSYMAVNLSFGLVNSNNLKWNEKRRLFVCDDLLNCLQQMGYTIQVVPLKEVPPRELTESERKERLRKMSIYDIMKEATKEGLQYSEYIRKYESGGK